MNVSHHSNLSDDSLDYSYFEKKKEPVEDVGTSSLNFYLSESEELHFLVERLSTMDTFLIEHVKRAENMCKDREENCILRTDFRKKSSWGNGSMEMKNNMCNDLSRAIHITGMLFKTHGMCAQESSYTFFVFTCLDVN